MQLLAFVVASANGPFTVAVGVAVVFVAVQASGLLSLLSGGDGDGDDADGDHDGADADGDGDAHPAHGAAPVGLIDSVLGPLGVGKIPLSLIWQIYLVVFGVSGLALNSRYVGGPVPLESLAWTLPISALLAYLVVALVARSLTPVLSSKEQEATRVSELNGQEGIVISSKVDQEFGEVRIRDRSGHTLRLVCRLEPGHSPVTEGQSVVVVGRNGAYLRVIPLDISLVASVSRGTPAKDVEKR